MPPVSGIGRPIDPSYPSNRYAVAATLLGGAAGTLIALARGEEILAAPGWGVAAGGAAFLAWAIGREIDPDRTWVAGVAAPLAAAAVAIGRPTLLGSAAVLLAIRLAARTTGRPPAPVDLVVLVGIAGWAASIPEAAAAAAVLALVITADRLLPGTTPAIVTWAGAAALAVVAAAAAIAGTWRPDPDPVEGWAWVVLAVSGAGLVSPFLRVRPQARCDLTGEPLHAMRIRLGRAVALAVLGAALAWNGGPGIVAFAPVGAAVGCSVLPLPGGSGRSAT